MNQTGEPAKKLYRSKYNRLLGGVCGGVADYLGLDVVLVRILWIIFLFLGGAGIILYIAALIIIPENPSEAQTENGTNSDIKKWDKTLFWGALFIFVGIIIFLKQVGFFHIFYNWNIPWQMIWALIFIALGVFLLINRNKEKQEDVSDSSYSQNNTTTPKSEHQIYRSRTDKMVAGVCGGLAVYFNLDPTLVRLIYVLISLASVGIGILIYILMMIIFPEEPVSYESDKQNNSGVV